LLDLKFFDLTTYFKGGNNFNVIFWNLNIWAKGALAVFCSIWDEIKVDNEQFVPQNLKSKRLNFDWKGENLPKSAF